MIAAALRTWLLQQASVTAAVGQRIHAGAAPRGTAAPRLELNVLDETPSPTMGGGTGPVPAEVELVISGEYYVTRSLRQILQDLLDGITHDLIGTEPAGGLRVQGCVRFASADLKPLKPLDGSDDWLKRIGLTFTCWYERPS